VYEQIRYEVSDPIATITLDRPKALNAWTNRMGAELKHAVARAEEDRSVVSIVITGEGRGFCAGADMNDLDGLSSGGRNDQTFPELDANPGDPAVGEDFRGTYTYLMSVRKPIIAAINGPVAGMAVPISLCCDMRFASDKALFTVAFSQRGLIAEWGVAWLLPRVVGPAHALDMLFSSRRVLADEAERIGLVNRVLPHDALDAAVDEWAERLAAGPPIALRMTKRLLTHSLDTTLRESLDAEAMTVAVNSATEDLRVAMRAFRDKREPRFQGR